jgi:hypothetical protein
MKMNIEISDQKETQLSTLKGKMLMKDSFLYKIEDYKIEERTETPEKSFFNRHPKPRTKLILTSITMRGYHSDGKFLGYMKEESVNHILVWFDLFWFRKTFVAFQEALQAFGYEITEIKKEANEPEEPETFAELGAKTFNERK